MKNLKNRMEKIEWKTIDNDESIYLKFKDSDFCPFYISNLKSGESKKIKLIEEDKHLLSVDIYQLIFRLAYETVLKDELKDNEDMHVFAASKLYEKPYSEVTNTERKDGKIYNFIRTHENASVESIQKYYGMDISHLLNSWDGLSYLEKELINNENTIRESEFSLVRYLKEKNKNIIIFVIKKLLALEEKLNIKIVNVLVDEIILSVDKNEDIKTICNEIQNEIGNDIIKFRFYLGNNLADLTLTENLVNLGGEKV